MFLTGFLAIIKQSVKLKSYYDDLKIKDQKIEKTLKRVKAEMRVIYAIKKKIYFSQLKLILAVKDLQKFLAQTNLNYSIREEHNLSDDEYIDSLFDDKIYLNQIDLDE